MRRGQRKHSILRPTSGRRPISIFKPYSAMKALLPYLLITPIKRLLLHALPYLAVVLLLAFGLFRGAEPLPARAIAGRALRYTLLWLLFVTAGLAALVLTGKPLLWLAAFLAATALLAALAYRKKPLELRRSLALVGLMGAFIVYSLA